MDARVDPRTFPVTHMYAAPTTAIDDDDNDNDIADC